MKFFNFSKKKEEQPQSITQNPDFAHMVEARAHGLMALWAADHMEKSSEESANYADKVVADDKPDAEFLAEINQDLIAADQHVDMEDLEQRLSDFKVIAKLAFEDEDKMGGCS